MSASTNDGRGMIGNHVATWLELTKGHQTGFLGGCVGVYTPTQPFSFRPVVGPCTIGAGAPGVLLSAQDLLFSRSHPPGFEPHAFRARIPLAWWASGV